MDATLLHAPALARRLRVPASWLRSEADAGRLPCLRAGRRYLFDAYTVERVLLARAAAEPLTPHLRPPREEVRDARPAQ